MTQPILNSEPNTDLDQAKIELERHVHLRSPRPSEAVLAEFPTLATDPSAMLELVYLEYVLLQEHGHEVEVDSFTARFPTLKMELGRMLEVDQAFNKLKRNDPPDTPFACGLETPSDFPQRVGFPHDGIGDYELLEVIGRGGMGLVYKARQKRLKRLVALKTIDVMSSFNAKVVARFKTEAELAAGLQHANIVPIYEIGTYEGIPFFSMELIGGGSLQDAMRSRPLRPKVAAQLIETLARAVAYAHERGVIHRDLKPANILLAPSNRSEAIGLYPGDTWTKSDALEECSRVEPKIADFGLAKQLANEVQRTQTGAVIGTPSFMAPEQIESSGDQVGPAADIYSLGAILYDTLVGRPPFYAATPLETLHQVRNEEPIAPRKLQSKIPRDLETICLTCLHKEPHRRYASAEALAEDLRRFQEGVPIRARAIGTAEHLARWVRRKPALAALVGTVLIATIGLLTLWRQAEHNRSIAEANNEVSKRVVYAQEIRLAQADLISGDAAAAKARLERTDKAFRNWEWEYLREQCGKEICQFKFDMLVQSVSMSPDGKLVAVGTRGTFGTDVQGDLAICEVETGRILRRLSGHPASIECVQFSPDGTLVASCGVAYDPKTAGGFCIWDVDTGELLHKHEVDAYSLAFAPDGKSIAVGLASGRVQLHSLQESEPLIKYTGHRGAVHGLAFRPDGRYLSSASRDGTVRIWSMKSNTSHPIVIGMEDNKDVRQIDWSSNGRDLVARNFGQSIRYLRQTNDNQVVQQRIQWLPTSKCVRFSPDGMFVVVCSLSAPPTIYNVRNGAVHGVIKCDGRVFSAAFDRLGRHIAFGCEDGMVRVWDLANCVAKAKVPRIYDAAIAAIAPHPTNSVVALARKRDTRHSEAISGKPRFDVLDLKSSADPRKIPLHSDWLTSIDYSSSGDRIASGSQDCTLAITDVESGRIIRSFADHDGSVTGVAFVDEGRMVASSSEDCHVRLFDVSRGTLQANWKSNSPVRFLKASPDGKQLIATTDDQWLYLLDAKTLAIVKSRSCELSPTSRLAFCRTNGMLAVGRVDGKVELWDRSDLADKSKNQPSILLSGHNGTITGIAFTSDGQRIATVGKDSCIKMWEIGSVSQNSSSSEITGIPEMLSIPVDCLGILSHICLTPDGRRMICWDDTRVVFDVALKTDQDEPIDDVRWHKWQLALARESLHRHAELFHLSQLCKLQPEQVSHLRERGFVHVKLENWLEAEQDLISVLSTSELVSTVAKKRQDNKRQDNALLLELARCQLQLGKIAEYRALCKQVEEKMGNYLNNWAWVASIAPTSEQDWKPAIEDFKKIKNIGVDPKTAANCNTLSMVLFRDGQFKEAIRWAAKGLKLSPSSNAPFDWLVLALTYAKLGDRERAQAWLDKVHRWVALQEQQSNLGQSTALTYERHRVPDLQLLVAEAKAMLESINVPSVSTEAPKLQ